MRVLCAYAVCYVCVYLGDSLFIACAQCAYDGIIDWVFIISLQILYMFYIIACYSYGLMM